MRGVAATATTGAVTANGTSAAANKDQSAIGWAPCVGWRFWY